MEYGAWAGGLWPPVDQLPCCHGCSYDLGEGGANHRPGLTLAGRVVISLDVWLLSSDITEAIILDRRLLSLFLVKSLAMADKVLQESAGYLLLLRSFLRKGRGIIKWCTPVQMHIILLLGLLTLESLLLMENWVGFSTAHCGYLGTDVVRPQGSPKAVNFQYWH